MLPSGKHASVPTFFECDAGNDFLNLFICYLRNRIKLIGENTENIFVLFSVKYRLKWMNKLRILVFIAFLESCTNFYGNGLYCRYIVPVQKKVAHYLVGPSFALTTERICVALFRQPYAMSQHLFPSRVEWIFWPRFCIDDRRVEPFLQSFPAHPKDF